jgi:hypothetical protein
MLVRNALVLAGLLVGAAACGRAPTHEAAVPTVFVDRDPGQGAPAAALPPKRPLKAAGTYRVAFSAYQEHGCSRSYAWNRADGDVSLELHPSGRAALVVTSRRTSFFGSSPLAFPGGARDATTWSEGRTVSWKGEAVSRDGKIAVVLRDPAARCEGGGSCAAPSALTLSCAIETIDVAPGESTGEAPAAEAQVTRLEVLSCTGAPAPFDHDQTATGEALPLSRGARLAISSRRGRWSSSERKVSISP